MDGGVARLMEHRAELVGYLRKQGLGDAEAEDLLQSALVRALEPWRTLPADEILLPWFYRVLRNAIIDRSRRRSAADRALERYAQEPPEADRPIEPRRICGCSRNALAALKPEYGKLIELVDVEGVAVHEAAQRAGISANNAHVRLHRARKALRDRLEAMCGKCATGGSRCSDCYCHPREPV